MHKQEPFEVRDIMKQPLSEAELRALAKKLGGIRELVAPKRRAETASLSDAALLIHLAQNPNHVRRPLIDTGSFVTAGFTAEVRARLSGTPPPPTARSLKPSRR